MPVITVRNLGGIGRFGNQCALYIFAKAYALRYGCELQVSDWIGRRIFVNATEALVQNPHLTQTLLDSETTKPMQRWFGRTDIDIRVYGQHQCYADFYTRKQVREWLTLKPEYEAFAPKEKLNAAHFRRGDICDNESFTHSYCSITDRSYNRAIEQFQIPKPVLMVYEGWRENDPALPPELSWLPDFLTLRDAPILLRANSTFSLFAGWIGHGKVYSPVVGAKVGWQDCEFVFGNHSCTAGKFHNQSDMTIKEE